ncbi:hypothetical protein [Hymenobacter sp. BRD67]|uniref:hypothetical protein n=1 Tax=Hymenobacter sp. BRD67 TaxID=2675877 RepID=UPI001565887F|nr:hypothetical protein [Hymenobacter sp. BRD67]QKG52049.1 hypothetical protein GKZ67_04790 [Hymenobacter sp. BRD67]
MVIFRLGGAAGGRMGNSQIPGRGVNLAAMQVYYFLLYKVWRVMQLSRQRGRFWRGESLTEATASTMVFIWSNWVLVGILMTSKIPYFSNSLKSVTTEYCVVSIGIAGFIFIYYLHKRLLKSAPYQAFAITFPNYSRLKNLLFNFLIFSLLLSLYGSPWVAAKWLFH